MCARTLAEKGLQNNAKRRPDLTRLSTAIKRSRLEPPAWLAGWHLTQFVLKATYALAQIWRLLPCQESQLPSYKKKKKRRNASDCSYQVLTAQFITIHMCVRVSVCV